MKKKNSLIELLRFVFAVNVVKNHGFFHYQGELFGPATISVEFFFVLSGYLFVSTLDKVKDKPLLKGVCSLYKNKILGLGIPLFVGLLFNVFYKVVAYQNDRFGFWGYHFLPFSFRKDGKVYGRNFEERRYDLCRCARI